MSNVENLAKMRALQEVYSSGRLMDVAEDAEVAMRSGVKLKRIQFDTSFELSERLDKVTFLLDMSRRAFLEWALIDALERAEATFASTYKEVTGHELAEGAK